MKRLMVLVACLLGAWLVELRAAEPEAAPAAVNAEIVEPLVDVRDPALQRSLTLLEQSAVTYTKKRECFSCHHQTLPAMTLALARQRGYDADAERMAEQAEFTLKFFSQRSDRLRKGDGVPGGPFTAGYALVGLHAAGRDADDTTAALVAYLLKTQEKDGRWRIRTHRPPLEDSDFTATALAVRGIRLFPQKDQAEEIDRRVADARKWLVATLDETSANSKRPLSNEDRTFRLLGLHWSDADKRPIAKAADDLLAQQQPDGGWAQLSTMKSDAYATGQALVALHEAGKLSTDHVAYRRGLDYLRKTQLTDGSWLVTTRSKPIQVYFESGFPHGKSQFISICGTSWAAQALLLGEPALAR